MKLTPRTDYVVRDAIKRELKITTFNAILIIHSAMLEKELSYATSKLAELQSKYAMHHEEAERLTNQIADSAKSSSDGGPAFPTQENVNDPRSSGLIFTQGMTLRDWFAGMALQGYMAYSHPQSIVGTFPESAAKTAYQCADEMLTARKGGA